MQLEGQNSHNRHVRLEPMGERHRAQLQAACAADLQVWRDLYPHSMEPEHFDAGWARMMAQAAEGSWIPHAVLLEGRCIGMTSYIGPDPANASVEIGGTYYHPDHRGGAVNPATKRLMLGHAFEAGARRVQLNVDAINHRSRAAVLKLGAVQEGILRQHRVVWTGRIRDTVVFSILAEEWPAVRAQLDARLTAL
ncbi:GNAT family N-acetyltransferase [Phenylobacterium sp.]|uniref:GNAT family N-acetyltransferase n=1 Tax=Phenylobacterium sp. TaxID=1871053 RepID=UPI002731EFD2|nr:GNAT family protein [Phenylobacterium sp.]MDP1874405.1 GNAT family protein [Phenylobacterium sp.]MDP3298887.1 GNAT family protein [Phenylobacterium sp.]MDP3489434.1 GNAT family protein [Phenylobacterium sp.]